MDEEGGRFSANLFLFLGLLAQITDGSEEVKAHVGTTVALPCRVDTSQCGDLHSVKWYRDTSRIYVFSQVGKIQRAEGDAVERMTVQYAEKSTEALLKISPVVIQDEASYKCEITYLEVRENCDVVQIIKLTTLVKPEAVRIISNDGIPMQNASILGPKDEGTEIELICDAFNGKPIPTVTWYNGSQEMTEAVYRSEDLGDGLGNGRSNVRITLTRGDLGATFRCEVNSEALDGSIVSWINAGVNVSPTGIELKGIDGHVYEGSNVLVACDVYGARPPAQVKWFNNSEPITDENLIDTVYEEQKDGTYTTKSSLHFVASRWEHGQAFYCSADNEVMRNQKETSLEKVVHAIIFFKPVVSVASKLFSDPLMINTASSNITTNETRDILLHCTYHANPQQLLGVVWNRNGNNLTLTSGKYEGGTVDNPPLLIKNVSREDMGEYTCICRNEVGARESENSIFLDVHYAPEVNVIMEPSIVKQIDSGNVTLECSVTAGNPSLLQKVRWYLGGELMKELPECNYTSFDDAGNGEGYGGPLCSIDPSVLSLERVDKNFAGNYTCQGKNIAGWGPESKPRELIVHFPPSEAKLRYTPSKVVKKASVTLDCSVDHPGRPDNVTFIWFRGSHQVHEVTTSNWTISPVTLETKSNFTCIAANEGGQSKPATVFINVSAPPAFIQNLPPYQGVLMSSENYSLTCRVECSPICSIVWFKDGKLINLDKNPLYYVRSIPFQPVVQKNDFESIESTLVWNISAWPGGQLDRTAPNSFYTCQSLSNGIGPGVNSTVEIAVDYPPENLTVSSRVVSVVENKTPEPVKCSGKGHPALSYVWKKKDSQEILSKNAVLQLFPLPRSASGSYVCEASNKHGNQSISVIFNVLYIPECSISLSEKNGNPALLCTAHANPNEVSFTWKIREANDTPEAARIINEGTKSYLELDSGVDTFRTYLCYANNSVGMSSACERDVAGTIPWWKRLDKENLLIIIAIIIGIIICVIIVCIIIILLCRKKRAGNKYNNPLEMEERENPDGHSPDTSGKWPLKPGVLVHINKMHNLNMSQLSPTSFEANQYKTTSVSKTDRLVNYAKSKKKVCGRLERLKCLLGFVDQDRIPIGISPGAGGAPNQTSTKDKTDLGGVPPGSTTDPLTNQEKGFYENLPFHGMQNPPNKPVSVIAPFVQGHSSHSSNSKSFGQNHFYSPPFDVSKSIKRNQSFQGFQQNVAFERQNFAFTQNFCSNWSNFGQNFTVNHNMPSVVCNFSENLSKIASNNAVGAVRPVLNTSNSTYHLQNDANLPRNVSDTQKQFLQQQNRISQPRDHCLYQNPFNIQSVKQQRQHRIVGPEKESFIRTVSHINENQKSLEANKPVKVLTEKRFGSLEIKKHRCYSPTFYSIRCKKHAKKRPIIYALPKKNSSLKDDDNDAEKCDGGGEPQNDPYEDLTDSIKIFEQNSENTTNELLNVDDAPKPAPRCRKTKKSEIIYANVCNDDEERGLNSSNESAENSLVKISVTEALVHNVTDAEDASPVIKHSPIRSPTTVKVSPNIKNTCTHNVNSKITKDDEQNKETLMNVPEMPILDPKTKWGCPLTNKNAFYTLTTPHYNKNSGISSQYSTIPHRKHIKLMPKNLFQDQQLTKSKSFNTKTKQKKHFQIPLQKCHSFKFQTAESYFQPIKNIHEENFMRNGYVSDMVQNSSNSSRQHSKPQKREKHKKGPLIVRRTGDYQENVQFQENVQNSVQLQYPQPLLGRNKQNGVVYADLDMPKTESNSLPQDVLSRGQKCKSKTEYATLKFNDIGQQIDV